MSANPLSKPPVLVITSHVADGAVGGRASVFALERLGFPVWFVPTAVLPWHPGRGRATATGLPPSDFRAVLGDLARSPALAGLGGALTGYFRDADEVAAVAGLITAAKAAHPGLLFVCDPIAGDGDGQYRPDTVVSAIRQRLLPLAEIITPNRYELAWLTGRAAGDNRALADLARRTGVREVAVTSAHALQGKTGTLLVTPETTVLALHDEIPNAPHGTGDLFSSLYLAHRLDGRAPTDALLAATSAVLAIVRLAVAGGSSEMPIVSGQSAFLDPPQDVTLEFLA